MVRIADYLVQDQTGQRVASCPSLYVAANLCSALANGAKIERGGVLLFWKRSAAEVDEILQDCRDSERNATA